MKVALLSDCYLPRLGGIEVQVHDLAGHLAAAGHEVEVFTATAGAAGERGGVIDLVDGVRVHRMALPLPGGVPVNPLAPPEVRRRLAAGGFEVAHVHMGVVSPFATDMARTAIGLGLPTAVTWHCVLDGSRPIFRAIGSARHWAGSGAALSAVSSMAAARVASIAGGADVTVLGNGIDPLAWAPQTGRMPRADQVVRVTSALRLARRKRPGALLDVLADARSRVPDETEMAADIFGDGPQRPILQRELDRTGLGGWVTLRGRVTRDALRAAHQGADLYLSTARLEAFGIAALEARTAGLPVIARRGTGVEDFVTDGLDGLLADDDAGLAVALARLATDSVARDEIARHNETVPPPKAWPVIVAATIAEYDRAARQSG
ncbi:MAG: glycosyltransferase family 4 protein [Nostocoides sp.]